MALKEGSKAWKKRQPKIDKFGRELFNPNELKCPITGYGSGLPTNKNNSGISVCRIIKQYEQ